MDVASNVIFGRATLIAFVMVILMIVAAISGTIQVAKISIYDGVNVFNPIFVVQDFHNNCKTLIDDTFNVIDVKPVESWKPSRCINHNRFEFMMLIVEHHLESRRGFHDIFWLYLLVAIFYFLIALQATGGTHFSDKVNISPKAFSIGWVVIAISLFPFTFRDHVSSSGFKRGTTDYYINTVYNTNKNKMMSCPLPLWSKILSCDGTDYYVW